MSERNGKYVHEHCGVPVCRATYSDSCCCGNSNLKNMGLHSYWLDFLRVLPSLIESLFKAYMDLYLSCPECDLHSQKVSLFPGNLYCFGLVFTI